tara:strand:- start:144 stop:308 length:165 start_codon:yes stop_codon:yes gene_type:complete
VKPLPWYIVGLPSLDGNAGWYLGIGIGLGNPPYPGIIPGIGSGLIFPYLGIGIG